MKYLDMIRQHEQTQPKDTVVDNLVEIIHPQAWRELAQMTAGLERDDPRLSPVLSALATCQALEKAGDQSGFEQAVERVRHLMLAPGARVEWLRAGTVQIGTADFLHEEADGTKWAFVTIGESLSAVNLKFAKLGDDETVRRGGA